jgi:hypothetical protein
VQDAIEHHLEKCLGLISFKERERLSQIVEDGYVVIEMVQCLKAAGCERLNPACTLRTSLSLRIAPHLAPSVPTHSQAYGRQH